MENVLIDLDDLFMEVRERAMSEGAFTQTEWDDVVDAILDAKREFGEVDSDDVDWMEVGESIKNRFEDFQADIPEV